jgi:acetyl-CoA carboxylase biotin carboxyl carrier protein
MDLEKIRALIELLDETNVAEIEITEGEEKIRVSRQYPAACAPAAPVTTVIAAPQPVHHTDVSAATPAAAAKEDSIKGHAMKSPMVGTVYLAPSPDAEPFVRVGQRVEAGAIVCMVEAMKMFNQIEADISGIIAGRLVENGQPVEYGQTLFIIEEE